MPKLDATTLAGWQDQVCVVTGAGSGIGEATAREFASIGARVAVVDRDSGAAGRVAADIERTGGAALGVVADVGSPETIAAAAARIQAELGPCRVLVNNAAVRHRGSLLDMKVEDWNAVMAVNLTGALFCTQSFVPQMIAGGRGGSIVHVGSILGHHPQVGGGAYGVAKAGMNMLSRVLALELAPHRIRSNVVSPGFTRTPANEASYRDPATAAAREARIPLGHAAAPEEVARVIVFLASDSAGYITAQDILVDGGVDSTLMSVVPRPAPK